MEARRNNRFAPVMRIREIQKNLIFYKKTLGFQVSEKLTRKDGRIVRACVGFDSPLLMLSPGVYVRSPQTNDHLAKSKLGTGVEFHFGMNGSRMLDEFFTEARAKGITVTNEPNQPYDTN
jgi:uncharacterized glyoxalase superfamily protein PhnB